MKSLNAGVAKVLKRLHYLLDVILTCVRWYVAYPLSLRHLEEMMAQRAFRSIIRSCIAGRSNFSSIDAFRGRAHRWRSWSSSVPRSAWHPPPYPL